MGLLDSVSGALDHAAGSTDEAWSRQFDDVEGGGFADELGAIADPTRSASPDTERDFNIFTRGGAGGMEQLREQQGLDTSMYEGPLHGGISDTLDRMAGRTPPDERESNDPLETPEGDGQTFSGADPTDPSDTNLYPEWLSLITDNLGLVAAGVIGLYVLTALGPVLEIVANLSD